MGSEKRIRREIEPEDHIMVVAIARVRPFAVRKNSSAIINAAPQITDFIQLRTEAVAAQRINPYLPCSK
jgi:hypothetical protein